MVKSPKAFLFRVLSILLVTFTVGIDFQADSYVQASPDILSMETLTADDIFVWRVYFSNLEELDYLTSRLDVWSVDHWAGYLVALFSLAEWQSLTQAGYRVDIDEERTQRLYQDIPSVPDQVNGIPGFPCYRTVEETQVAMTTLAIKFPHLAKLVDIGNSWEKEKPGNPAGYDIFALVLTNENIPGPKPKFFLMAESHARELATTELAIRFAEYLLVNYNVDPDITWLLDYYEVHIVPMANPDGRKKVEAIPHAAWRKNTDNDDGCTTAGLYGTDLNRNHSFKWGGVGSSGIACEATYRGPSQNSEPETRAIQTYVNSIFPDQRGNNDNYPALDDTTGVFITLHSFGELVLFPWGWTSNPSPNNTDLETLGRKFGYFNHYVVCQSGESGCIYQTSGSSDDWAYGRLGVAAYTFEMGTEFFQSCSVFENTILPDNLPALVYAIKSSRRPYQNPAGPDTVNVTLTPSHITSSTLVDLTATANDTRYNDNGWPGSEPTQNITAARFSIDAPAWITNTITYNMSPSDGAFDERIEGIQANLDITGLAPGRHTIFVESQDGNGNWGVPNAVFLWVETYKNPIFLPWTSLD